MWHPLHAFGFIYYEAWLSAQTHRAIAWISRKSETHPYTVFYCDGKHKESGERGSAAHAREYAAEMVARYGG